MVLALAGAFSYGCGGGGTVAPQATQPDPPPSIVAQPTSQTVTAGQPASFSVTATGTAPLSYQWRKSGVAVAGATGSNYATPATVAADSGVTFDVMVSNAAGSVDSAAAMLTVNTAPAITQQPANQTVTAGQPATFAVTATGSPAPTYQWRKNGTNIGGAAGASYTTPATDGGDNGAAFDVVIGNAAGTITSTAAALTVNVPPAIAQQPTNQAVTLGQTATFSVVATGNPAPAYQWQRVGVNIAGATGSSYTTPPTATADNGATFDVVLTNVAGSVTSGPATLQAAAGAPASIQVETASDGTGTLLAIGALPAGSAVTGYAITRDAGGNFVANAAASWSLANITGGVVAGDLAASADGKSVTFTAHKVGTAEIRATSGALTATVSGVLTVNPAAASALVVTGFPATASAGAAATFSVTALDPFGNTASGFSDLVHFSASDSQAILPPNAALAKGAGSFTATFKSAGTQFLSAADAGNAAISGTQSGIAVVGATTTNALSATATFSTANQSVPLSASVTSSAGTVNAGTITFTVLDGASRQIGGAVTSGTVSGGSANAVFTLPGGTGAGTYTIAAVYSGSTFFGASNDAPQTLTVMDGTAVVTLGTVTATYDGTGKATTATTNPSGLTTSFTYTGVAGTVYGPTTTPPTNAGSYAVSAAVNDVNYQGSATGTLVIAKSTPTITWATQAAVTYGTTLTGTQLNATASVPGSFAYAPGAGTTLGAGNETLGATFTPADAADYTGATASVTLVVNKGVPTITWAVPAAITYGTALSAAELNATANVPGSFAYTPDAGAVPGAGNETLGATFTPTDAADYTSATASVSLTVGKATAGVSLGSLAQTYDAAPLAATATTTPPGLAVEFSYSQGGTTVTAPTAAGSYSVTATVDDSNYQGAASGTLVIGKATPAITWPAPADIPVGTPLSETQLNATANTPGSFVYVPAAGTVLTVGSQTLATTFTPADTADYTAATANVPLTVTFPPSIVQQPASQTVNLGQTTTFTVAATGAAPLSYQWRLNGLPVGGATGTTYTTLAATAQDGGAQYDVVVTNVFGNQTSSIAALSVLAPPVVALQPANQTVLLGQPATFTTAATGGAPLNYQWQKDGTNIVGATSSTYTTPPPTILDAGALFTVVVSNEIDSITSGAAMLTVNLASAIDVATYHNDNSRTGQNQSETILSPANVNSASFGISAFLPTDGQVDAQPLYLSNVAIPNLGMHNVVYAATENDSVYAFDAVTGVVLWRTSVLGAGEAASDDRGCSEVTPQIGITATPVIDRTRGPNGAIYVVAMSTDGAGNYFQRLHALDAATGAELFGGPTTISASFPGTGDGSNGASVVFDPAQHLERAALLLSNGLVYTAWASHCNARPYTGWVMAFDANTLQMTNALNLAPNGNGGGITMGGAGLTADSAGNVYLLDGRGTFDSALNTDGFPSQGDFGNAFLKLSTSGGLAVADYFAPSNTAQQSAQNMDLGSGGLLLLPDLTDGQGNVQHLAVGAGQDTNIYVASRDSMGKFSAAGDQIYQEVDGVLTGGTFTAPAYFNNTIYFGPSGSPLQAFSLGNALLGTTPASQSGNTFPAPGAAPAISANGVGGAILWAVESDPVSAVLHAYDATNLGNELYSSAQETSGRDTFGGVNPLVTPTVANASVFIGTMNGIAVFGLLPSGPANAAPSILSEPVDQLVNPGQTATFTIAVAGSAPLSYQWQKNGMPIPGATSSSYTTPAAATTDDRTVYTIMVSNVFGSVSSDGALLDVNAAPQIDAQPGNQSVTPGQTATFTVGVFSPYPLSYKWQMNGIDLPGANSSSYTTPPAVLADSGEEFTVVVSNGLGNAISATATLQVAPASATATYYVDFYGGSDGNNGVSAATSWQHAPGMNGCAANCGLAVLHPGDRVIFRGGVTWDLNAFPMAANWSGTSASPIYYGVDQTWFLGAAWTRPVFDLAGTAWSAAPLLVNSASDVVFDNLEIENEQVAVSGAAAPLGSISVSGGSNVAVQNCYVHGWSTANPGPGGDSAPFGGIVFGNGATGGVVRNCTFDGSPASNAGTGVFGAQIVQNDVFERMPNAISVSDPAADVSGNQIFNLTDSVDSLASRTAIQVSGGGKIYNNIVHDLPSAGTALYLDSFQAGAGNTQAAYNNLIWNAGSAPAIVVDPGAIIGTSASFQALYNNTVAGGAAGCVRTISGPLNFTDLVVDNNLCISDQTTTPAGCWNGAGGNALCGSLAGVVASTNVTLDTATASTQGYTIANGFQSASVVGASVGAGLNLSASCVTAGAALCSDRLGIARPGGELAWDEGAYQYQAPAANLPPSIVVQPVSATIINGNSATFNVVALGSGPLAYQWQADGASIDSATASSFTVSPATLADDGTQLTVVVSGAQGSVTSSVALISVLATQGELDPSVAALSFGNIYVGTSSALAVQLTNGGDSNVDISNVSVAGAGFGASGLPSGLILAPGESTTLTLTFSPAAAGGVTGAVAITSDASNSPLTISVYGSGAPLTTHGAILSWNGSASVVRGYNVYRSNISGGPYALLNSLLLANTTYADLSDPGSNADQTLFTSQLPGKTAQIDGPGVTYELGTQFQADVPGRITTVRFWKDASESGTHIGSIWSVSGQLLASVVFTNETASGWQQQALAAPLSIVAGTPYVVSVNTPNGYYVDTDNGLTVPVVNQHLSTVGDNGVYGPPGQLPTNVFLDSNYFRDVVFEPLDAAVQSGQTYFYVVTSVAPDGLEGPPSNEVTATIPSP